MIQTFKTLLTLCLLLCGASMNAMEYTLSPLDLTAEQGSNATLSVEMNNEDVTILSFQCDMYLPEGVTVATSSNGNLLASLNEDRIDDHIITTASQFDGAIRYISYSMSNAPYKGSDGLIFTTPLVINAAPGTYQITIKNASLTKEDYSEIFCPEISATLTIESKPIIVKGDANGDGKINVSDIAIIIDYMLERNPSNFEEGAADVNGDGKINVIDISGIIQILLSR